MRLLENKYSKKKEDKYSSCLGGSVHELTYLSFISVAMSKYFNQKKLMEERG